MSPAQNENQPNYRSGAYHRQQVALQTVRDVYAGTLRMRARGKSYLPQFALENEKSYTARVQQATLFNGFARTVRGLAGMVFRKDLVLGDDVPERIAARRKNIDRAGQSLDVVARELLENMLVDGHVGLFVDRPQRPPGVTSILDEERSNLEPYWVVVPKEDILSWWTDASTGQVRLTRVAFRRFMSEPRGRFGEVEIEVVRNYFLAPAGVGWEVWRRETGMRWTILGEREPLSASAGTASTEWRLAEEGTMTGIDEIPFMVGYAQRKGFLESDPPLLDLALENVLHWQVRSDRLNSLHIAGVPIAVFVGLQKPDQQIAVGPDMAVKLPLGGDAKYLEPQGSALGHMRDELADIEQRMAALGLSMLMRETRSAETAEAKRIEHSLEQVTLSSVASALEDLLNEALRLHARWLGLPDGGRVSVNRDFERQMLGPAMIAALSALVGEAKLSLRTLWEILVKGEVLPAGFDPEEEAQRIADTAELMPFVAAAAAAQPPVGNGGQPSAVPAREAAQSGAVQT